MQNPSKHTSTSPTDTSFPENWLLFLDRMGVSIRNDLQQLETKLEQQTDSTVFPPANLRYAAFDLLPPESCSVCLIGQDCYHGWASLPDGQRIPQATGLCFSVPSGAKLPPSLRNIFKEREADTGQPISNDGNLSHWGEQGCLMLNSILSVECGKPASHKHLGWQSITGKVIEGLSRYHPHLVFIMWGKYAQSLKVHIQNSEQHTQIESSHPSPIGLTPETTILQYACH